jgi:hypothetical protein
MVIYDENLLDMVDDVLSGTAELEKKIDADNL